MTELPDVPVVKEKYTTPAGRKLQKLAESKERKRPEFIVRDEDGNPVVIELAPGKLKMVKPTSREYTKPTHEGAKHQTLKLSKPLKTGSTMSVQLQTEADPVHYMVIPEPAQYVGKFVNSVWVRKINKEDIAIHYSQNELPLAPPAK